MDDSNGLPLRRLLTLLVVLSLHMALIAALVMASRSGNLPTSPVQSVELLFLPPASLPKVRAENLAPRRWSGDTAITVALPSLESASFLLPPASSSDGRGSGVDWAAEARRALRAFDIRQHQPLSSHSISSDPVEDEWWPYGNHHAGDRFKTANGDWIVWISDNCYQVAISGSTSYVPDATLAQTVCPSPSRNSSP